jgi:HK97 family phage major capsid protein
MLPIGVALSVWDLILINGAFRELGVVSLSTMETKVVQATANPTASWLTPSQIGNTITADTTLTGNNTTPECNSLGILLPVSRELLQDNKVNLAFYLLTRFSEALAGAIDYASLQGDGTADAANGGITGLWADSTVSKVNAASGNTTVASLLRSDFLAAVSACAPAALQRECKWIISPSLLTPLMALVDTNAKAYLLQTPSATGGPWKLCGFDVVWAAQAPATQTAGSTIAIFGHLPSYLVAIREELEVMLRDGNTGFQSNEKSFRAMARAFCQTRAASGLVKFALAAS